MKLRLRVLREEPLCRHCMANGVTAASTEVDHIRRLGDGGGNERANLQGLCTPCHEAKTRSEMAVHRNG